MKRQDHLRLRPGSLRLGACTGLAIAGLVLPAVGRAADVVPGKIVVGYSAADQSQPAVARASRSGGSPTAAASRTAADAVTPRLVTVPHGVSVQKDLARLRRDPRVAYAVPDYIAHAAGAVPGWFPDDRGRSDARHGWESLQWNFLPGAGVNAPLAWSNLRDDGHPGGRGAVVAVIDTGIAYRNWRGFHRSPDFATTRFVSPFDFVANNPFPLDREGHGTFVAGTIAEATDNGLGLTGLAYGASIMPVRVLDGQGNGDADTIAKGIRYAATHGAQVINLSLEFPPDVKGAEIPEIISAIRFATRRGTLVVAAAGNEGDPQNVSYPARAPTVLAVGATTRDRCLADYSNRGPRVDLVAPGGGDDAPLPGVPQCHPERSLPSIYQMTFGDSHQPNRFGYPGGMFGTSMSTPHVAGAAALVIASGVIGRHPTPDQVKAHLEQTAQPLGSGQPNTDFGYGLVDAGAATTPVVATGTKKGR